MQRKLIFALLLALFLAACGPAVLPTTVAVSTETPATAPISLTDGLGRTVTLAAPAQTVVSLAPSNTEILFAVGAGSQVIGRDETSDYPPEAQSLPTVGGYSGFNAETIVALHPDLVLGQGDNFTSPELVASLEGLGLTVYVVPNPSTLEEMYANLETVARLTGRETEAAALVSSLQARVAAVDDKVLPLSYAPTVYYEIDATDPTKPYTYGPGSFGELLIRRAGGINVASQLEGQWAQISLEQLVVADPAIVLLGDSYLGETPEKFAARPGLQNLAAIKNGQVYAFDDNLVSRPGPRLVDGLEALAKLFHPDLFK